MPFVRKTSPMLFVPTINPSLPVCSSLRKSYTPSSFKQHKNRLTDDHALATFLRTADQLLPPLLGAEWQLPRSAFPTNASKKSNKPWNANGKSSRSLV